MRRFTYFAFAPSSQALPDASDERKISDAKILNDNLIVSRGIGRQTKDRITAQITYKVEELFFLFLPLLFFKLIAKVFLDLYKQRRKSVREIKY